MLYYYEKMKDYLILIPTSAADAAAVNPKGIKALLTATGLEPRTT